MTVGATALASMALAIAMWDSLATIVEGDIVPTIVLEMESVTRANVFAIQDTYQTIALC